jgi:hypothetical protein
MIEIFTLIDAYQASATGSINRDRGPMKIEKAL